MSPSENLPWRQGLMCAQQHATYAAHVFYEGKDRKNIRVDVGTQTRKPKREIGLFWTPVFHCIPHNLADTQKTPFAAHIFCAEYDATLCRL